MKITANQPFYINISAGKEAFSFIKNINQGDIISATIIRSEGNRAVLETGGKQITAEFISGVPGEKTIDLLLVEKTQDKIVFTLAEKENQDKIITMLSRFCLLPEDEVKKNSLQNFARFINTSRPDLIDMNLFLLGLKRERDRQKKDSHLFMNLQHKGIPHQALIDLGFIIYSRYNPLLYQAYRYLLNLTGNKPHFLNDNDSGSIEKAIDNLSNLLKDDDNDFSVMFDLLFDDHKNNMSYGRMAIPDGKIFSDAEFVLNNDSVFFKLDLSSTGILEILIRLTGDSILINFLSEKDDVIEFLKKNEGILTKMLEEVKTKKSSINYYHSKKVVDKIYLWCLNFYTKSKFSVKV